MEDETTDIPDSFKRSLRNYASTGSRSLEEYCEKDARVTYALWKRMTLPWYKKLWMRILYGPNWLAKFHETYTR